MSKAPKLRFKEFSGDWEEDELGNIIEISKSKYNPLKNEEDYKCIELENLSQETGQLLGYFNSKEQQSIKNKFNKGEVLFGKLRPYLKKYWLADFEGVCSSEIWVLNGIKASNNFIYRLIQTDKFNFISNISSGSKMPRADWSYMREFPFFIPKLEEQEKIASFFSLIDDKISLQGEKVEALKDYKKGMMQKIFSRELRFKDDEGRDYPEWEEKKLNQLGDTYTGLSGKTKENFGIGECKYVIYKNVFGNTIAKEDEVELVEINEGESQNKVIKGDLLFTTSSETPEEVGMVSCWNYDVEDLYLNSFCFGYRLFDLEQYSPIFIAYLLRSESYRRKISILGQGSTRYNISKNELMKMKIKVPVIEEQRKIVSLLLGIESKIEKEQEKLDSLNEYKKGLLQQMFV